MTAAAKMKKGLNPYIDAGVWGSTVESVTRAFYERSWSRIDIESVPKHFMLEEHRPEDRNLQLLIGYSNGISQFYVFPERGISAPLASVANRHELRVDYTPVLHSRQLRRLDSICTEYKVSEVETAKTEQEKDNLQSQCTHQAEYR